MLYSKLLRNNGSPMSTTKKKKKQWNRWYTRCTDVAPPPPALLCTGRQSELQDSAVIQCQGNEMTGL